MQVSEAEPEIPGVHPTADGSLVTNRPFKGLLVARYATASLVVHGTCPQLLFSPIALNKNVPQFCVLRVFNPLSDLHLKPSVGRRIRVWAQVKMREQLQLEIQTKSSPQSSQCVKFDGS